MPKDKKKKSWEKKANAEDFSDDEIFQDELGEEGDSTPIIIEQSAEELGDVVDGETTEYGQMKEVAYGAKATVIDGDKGNGNKRNNNFPVRGQPVSPVRRANPTRVQTNRGDVAPIDAVSGAGHALLEEFVKIPMYMVIRAGADVALDNVYDTVAVQLGLPPGQPPIPGIRFFQSAISYGLANLVGGPMVESAFMDGNYLKNVGRCIVKNAQEKGAGLWTYEFIMGPILAGTLDAGVDTILSAKDWFLDTKLISFFRDSDYEPQKIANMSREAYLSMRRMFNTYLPIAGFCEGMQVLGGAIGNKLGIVLERAGTGLQTGTQQIMVAQSAYGTSKQDSKLNR